MVQTTRNQVSIQKQALFRIPVPPINEQRRISARLDSLMALCDNLEHGLASIETAGSRILQTLTAGAVSEDRGL